MQGNSESHEGLAQAVESAHIGLKDRHVDDNTRVFNLSGSEKPTDGPEASESWIRPLGDRRSVSENNDPQNDLPIAAESEPQSRAEEEKDPSANGVGSPIGGQKEREDRDAEGDSTDDDVVEVAAFSESDGVRVLVPPLQKSRPNIGSGGSTKRKDDREQSRSSIGDNSPRRSKKPRLNLSYEQPSVKLEKQFNSLQDKLSKLQGQTKKELAGIEIRQLEL
ncbi:hypothetical protein OEA41_010835 [Lepraria neglecta]|uniref:Uncharacterized protein n=1 Tax=Lepraria neglecta TaxID=209136 RepID=A0AAD9Z0H5_9LECA|nr:hypothetical protein OEA41_010835 [Lepraria neglecta]